MPNDTTNQPKTQEQQLVDYLHTLEQEIKELSDRVSALETHHQASAPAQPTHPQVQGAVH